MAGKLEGESWEDLLEVAAGLEVSRAKEAGPEFSIHEGRVSECLGDS